jgi:hypothetical protein
MMRPSDNELDRLFQVTPPPEPTAAEWDDALVRIEAGAAGHAGPKVGVERYLARNARTGRRWTKWVAAAAAVVLLTLASQRIPWRPNAVEPFPVASWEEIEILSVHDPDMAMVVVGDSPLREPMALATGQDVIVENIQPDVDGMMPDLGSVAADTTSPMIVAPMAAPQPEEKAP